MQLLVHILALLTTIFPSGADFWITCSIFFIAEVVYVAFGFGAGLIAVGALALVLPNIQDVVVLLLLVNVPVEIVIVWKSRALLQWQGLLTIMVGVGVGIMVGTFILLFGTPIVLLTVLGAFLFVSGTVFAISPQKFYNSWPAWSRPVVGLIAGLLAGLFGTGGPPLIFYYQLQGIPKTQFRSNLMAIFFGMTLVRFPSYIIAGLITNPRFLAALIIFPAVLIGAFVGNKIHLEIEEGFFRRLVGIALALIGCILLLRHM